MVCDLRTTTELIAGNGALNLRAIPQDARAAAGAFGMGVSVGTRSAAAATSFDAKVEAKKITFDRAGKARTFF
jgi:hypothetical protein